MILTSEITVCLPGEIVRPIQKTKISLFEGVYATRRQIGTDSTTYVGTMPILSVSASVLVSVTFTVNTPQGFLHTTDSDTETNAESK